MRNLTCERTSARGLLKWFPPHLMYGQIGHNRVRRIVHRGGPSRRDTGAANRRLQNSVRRWRITTVECFSRRGQIPDKTRIRLA